MFNAHMNYIQNKEIMVKDSTGFNLTNAKKKMYTKHKAIVILYA